MKQRESFLFYRDWWNSLKPDDAVRHEVIDAIMTYVFDGVNPSVSPLAQMALSFIIPYIDRDTLKYQETCEKRKKAVQSRWKKNAEEYNSIQKHTNATDNDNENVNGNENDNGNENVNDNDSLNSERDNIKDSHTLSPEESYFEEAWKNESWKESVCMNHKISKDSPELEKLWQEFRLVCKADNKCHDGGERDVQAHFNRWLYNRKNNNGNSKTRQTRESRLRAAEITATSAEDYETDF